MNSDLLTQAQQAPGVLAIVSAQPGSRLDGENLLGDDSSGINIRCDWAI